MIATKYPSVNKTVIDSVYLDSSKSSVDKLNELKSISSEIRQQDLPKNVVTYEEMKKILTKNLQKNKRFDFRWSSLLSNEPLLFEDMKYVRVRRFIKSKVTQQELEWFRNGELNHIFNSFEQLLLCNMKHYNRILNYALMVFEKYVMLEDDEDEYDDESVFDKVIQEIEMTPTQLYCAAMINPNNTTVRELTYGYSLPEGYLEEVTDEDREEGITSVIQKNWDRLYKHPNFKIFNELNALRLNVNGFRTVWYSERTPNDKLGQICRKMTRLTMSVTKPQLQSVHRYIEEINDIQHKLYQSLYKCLMNVFDFDDDKFAIYVYTNEFYIFSERFNMKVSKTPEGRITKDYLSNSYECFMAEEYLVKSIREQINWAKYQQPLVYDYDKNILKGILLGLLEKEYRDTVLLKRPDKSSANGTVSKITFSGIFRMVKIKESFMFKGKEIYSHERTLSKFNAADYLINKGYYLFGLSDDIVEFVDLNQQQTVNHYMKYTIPVDANIQRYIDKTKKLHMQTEYLYKTNGDTQYIKIKEPIYVIGGYDVKSPLYKGENKRFPYIREKQILRDSLEIQKRNMGFRQDKHGSYWKVTDISTNL